MNEISRFSQREEDSSLLSIGRRLNTNHRCSDPLACIRIQPSTISYSGAAGNVEEQAKWARILFALKQVKAGRTAEDVARESGVSKHTIYGWRVRFGGMQASDVR